MRTQPPTHIFLPPNVSGLRQGPGRLTPSLHTHFPSSPFPPAYPLSDRPLFTFTLLHGPAGWGGGESLHYCLVLPRAPRPTQPDPIHSPQKRHLYHPTVREWARSRDGARRGENKVARKETMAKQGGKEGERQNKASVLHCLSESICQILHSMKATLLLSCLPT